MPLAQTTVRSGTPQYVTVTIANGASLSGAGFVDGKLCGLLTDTAWTAASMTFQGSVDGGVTFADIWDTATGTAAERTIASGNIPTAAQRFFPLNLNDNLTFTHIKVRSGPQSLPVNQGAARTITLVLAG